MLKLRKFVAPEFVFGIGARHRIGRYASNFGARHVFLVTDPGVIAAGWVAQVVSDLAQEHIPCTVFSEVSPNPRAEQVMHGVEMYQSHHCDLIVAVGGGSPMDCAKGIGISSTNQCSVLAFEGIDQVDIPGPPLICIPTTAGTAADISQFAIISDPPQRVKRAIISKTVIPDVALIDPETTVTMDRHLTACTALDALVHAIEAFVSTAHSPITDLHALAAMRLIRGHLQAALHRLDDLHLREQLMLASLHAGLAFSNTSLGAVHAMAHSVGGFLDLAHGETNALLLAPVVACNYTSAPERFDVIAETLGLNVEELPTAQRQEALMQHLIDLRHAAGITDGLQVRGVHTSDIPTLSHHALNDPCMVTNPRRLNRRDVEVLYEEAC